MMVLRDRFDCVVSLLSHGADSSLLDKDGNTALRLAVENLNVQCVKALVVFDADVHELNAKGHTLRHGIACGQSPADDVIYVLHSVGVKRCEPSVRGCSPSCSAVDCKYKKYLRARLFIFLSIPNVALRPDNLLSSSKNR